MAGFFALPARTFKAAADLNPIGYKIGLELMVKCRCRKVRETPIHFRDRQLGKSKLTLKEQLNYLRHLARLYVHRLGRIPRAARFMLVGATGAAVDVAALSMFLMFLSLPVARAAAIWLAMTWNYVLNRKATFADAARRPIPVQYGLFCLSCLAGAAVNWSVTVALCAKVGFFHNHPVPAALLGVAAGFVLNYLLCCSVVFRSKTRRS
jgi:dolichol-phosphate mannosyltransferase